MPEELEGILQDRLAALEALSWIEMDSYGERVEPITTASGERYRVVTGAFWDMDEWGSGMELYVKAYATSGLRRLFPFKLWASRGGPGDLVPEPPAGWEPARRRGK